MEVRKEIVKNEGDGWSRGSAISPAKAPGAAQKCLGLLRPLLASFCYFCLSISTFVRLPSLPGTTLPLRGTTHLPYGVPLAPEPQGPNLKSRKCLDLRMMGKRGRSAHPAWSSRKHEESGKEAAEHLNKWLKIWCLV